MHDKKYWRKVYLDESNVEWKDLEKYLLTIVGGTLAASTTFFTNNNADFVYTWVLGIAWISLSWSLLFLLISYGFAEYRAAHILSKIKNHEKDFLNEDEVEEMENDSAESGIIYSNYISFATACLGIVALALFGYLNI